MKKITVRNKAFVTYLGEEQIATEVKRIAGELNTAYAGKNPVFLGVLNGSFMFFGDLMKHVHISSEVAFIKAASYEGMHSTGKITFSEAGQIPIKGRHIVIIEDIVDTGKTLLALKEYLKHSEPESIATCTLLFKKEAYKASEPIEYACFEVANKFLLGYGLDYDGLGRNSADIFILNE